MKLNIANPSTGSMKQIEIEDDKKYRKFYDLRLAEEIPGELIGDECKGYILKITGGNDKQGFPMKQGVLTTERVRLLLKEGDVCFRRYRGQKRRGTRKRKSVRGCIVSSEIGVLSLIIVKKGEQEIDGLTNKEIPNRLGPKRASKIRKLFNLSKKDDVREYVIRRELKTKEGSKRKKPRTKAPKIQRLVTPRKLLHRRQRKAAKAKRRARSLKEAQAYAKLLAKRRKETISKRRQIASRRSRKSKNKNKNNK